MNIKICNYEIMNFDDITLVMSEKGLSRITSPAILEAIEELQPYIGRDIPANTLEEIILPKSVNTVEAIAFLKQCLNIVDRPATVRYDKVIIIHDRAVQTVLLELIKEEISHKTVIVSAAAFDKDMVKGKKDFIVILQSEYDYHSLKTLYFAIAKVAPKSAIVVGHYTPDHYCISQPYFFEIGNPCHFCHIDRLLDYEKKKDSKNNWARLLKFSNQHGYKIPGRKHSHLHQSLAASLLTNRINLFTAQSPAKRHQDSVLASASINLLTGKIDEEIVPHWVLCQCQRSVS